MKTLEKVLLTTVVVLIIANSLIELARVFGLVLYPAGVLASTVEMLNPALS